MAIRPVSPDENRSVILEEKLSSLDSTNKIIFFEISKVVREAKSSESDRKRVAWAFLVPVASDGTKNINKDLKLQVYKTKKRCKVSHKTCDIYHLYKDHKWKKYPGILCVKIAGAKPETNRREEVSNVVHQEEEPKKSIVNELKEIKFSQVLQWSRLPTQSCKIPNQLHTILCFGNRGSSCVRFSRTGTLLAVASGERIFVYDILSFTEQHVLKGHDGFIYDIDWSDNDCHMLSVSNDCLCIIWHLTEKIESLVIPHPSYVYCGIWTTPGTSLITGCKDHLIRCWMKNGDNFELSQEVHGHSGFVTSLALQGSSVLISGDSNGCININTYHDNQWVLIKQMELNETSSGITDSIQVCNSRSRVIVTSRSKGSFMVDLKIGIITQKYEAIGNVIFRSVPCLSPCGSLFFSFCSNGEVGVWNAHNGKHLATYENLFSVKGVSEICGTIHYNPFEHMMAVGALDNDHPVLILKHGEEDQSGKLGLIFNK